MKYHCSPLYCLSTSASLSTSMLYTHCLFIEQGYDPQGSLSSVQLLPATKETFWLGNACFLSNFTPLSNLLALVAKGESGKQLLRFLLLQLFWDMGAVQETKTTQCLPVLPPGLVQEYSHHKPGRHLPFPYLNICLKPHSFNRQKSRSYFKTSCVLVAWTLSRKWEKWVSKFNQGEISWIWVSSPYNETFVGKEWILYYWHVPHWHHDFNTFIAQILEQLAQTNRACRTVIKIHTLWFSWSLNLKYVLSNLTLKTWMLFHS